MNVKLNKLHRSRVIDPARKTFVTWDVQITLSVNNVSALVMLFYAGIVLASFAVMLLHGHTFLIGYKIGMISRIIMTGAVYQKVLSLNQVMVGQISIGHIVNLASNDVQRFDLVCSVHIALARRRC